MRIPLLIALRKKGYSVVAAGSENGTAFEESGVPYHRYALNPKFNPFSDALAIRQLYNLFKEFRPSIVHAFDTKPGILAIEAAKKAKIKARIRTIVGMGNLFSSSSFTTRALRPMYRYFQTRASHISDCTVFQNSFDQKIFSSA